MTQRSLTEKEQMVIDHFEQASPGLGKVVEKTITNPNSGYSKIIAEMDEGKIQVKQGFSANSFMYKRVGG